MALTYFRTTHGDHRHADYTCANTKRAIASGDPIAIPASEVASWAPCSDCCTADDVKAGAAAKQAAADTMCPNRGVAKPQRMRSTCRDCGKEGAVNRSTGSIRAHKRES